jgi:hypothetical protein
MSIESEGDIDYFLLCLSFYFIPKELQLLEFFSSSFEIILDESFDKFGIF